MMMPLAGSLTVAYSSENRCKSKFHSDDVRQQLLKLHQQGRRFTYPASDLMPIGNKKSVDTLVQEILDERNQ